MISLSLLALLTLSILLVPLQKPYVHEGHEHVYGQQQDGWCSSLPQVELLEYLIVDAQSDYLGAPSRAAACQGEHHIEGVESLDRDHYQIYKKYGSKQGQHYVGQSLPSVGPVHPRSIHHVTGEGLQPGVEQDHTKSCSPPDVRNCHRDLSDLRVREKGNGETDRAEDVVQNARRGLLVEDAPNDADNHARNHPG